MDQGHKRVFISYANVSDEYNDLVSAFADALRVNGVDARVDRLFLGKKSSPNLYYEFAKNIEDADKVIVILSKKYKEKFEKLGTGVRFEGELILSDRRVNPDKYILAVLSADINDTVLSEVVPFCFTGAKIYAINRDRASLDTIIRKIYDVPEYEFSDVAPEVVFPASQPVSSWAEWIRTPEKKSKSFEFNNLFLHTIYTIGEDRKTITYEVYRCIQVMCLRLSELEIRPQFLYKVPVNLSSSLVSLPSLIEMDEKCVARFKYPIPKDTQKGDILSIHYKLSMVYPEKESVCRFSLRSENDSLTEIHDVVLAYRKTASDARLTILEDDDFIDKMVDGHIPFDDKTQTYRFVLSNPKLNSRYMLSWDNTEDE